MWGEGLTPSLQATGSEELPVLALQWGELQVPDGVGTSSAPGVGSQTTIVSPHMDEEGDLKEEAPKTKPCPTFLGVCRQRLIQWAVSRESVSWEGP